MSAPDSSKHPAGDSSRHKVVHRRHRAKVDGSYMTPLHAFALVGGLLLLVAVGGGSTLWSQALVIGVFGIWLVIKPPLKTPSRKLDWVLLVLVLWSFTAYLPVGLLGQNRWRKSLEAQGLDTGWFQTVQPWVTFESIALMCVGFACFYAFYNLRIGYDDRRRLLWMFTIGMAILALGSMLAYQYDYRSPFQANTHNFSYFPNKNHTGLVLAMGAITAFGLTVHMIRCQRRLVLLSIACLLLSFGGVLFSLSRAALLLFFVGCLISYLLAFDGRRSLRLLKYITPVIVLLMFTLMLLGRESLSRFGLWRGFDETPELRLAIYQDTLRMVANLPAGGLSLGNYAAVFPQFRQASEVEQRIIHPESDWLWVMAELGIPGFSILLLAVLLAMSRFVPFGSDKSMAYRVIAFGPLVILLLHNWFDVPAHRFGALLLGFLFYRLAVMELPREPASVFPPWAYRAFGIVMVGLSVVWMAATVFNLPWQTRVVAQQALDKLSLPMTADNRDAIFEGAQEGLNVRPLDWWLYTQRARAKLVLDRDISGARDDFLIARVLEPLSAEVPFQEGVSWLPYNDRLAMDAWREAIERNTDQPESLYRGMLTQGGKHPRFSRELADLSTLNADFRYMFLTTRRGDDFDNAINLELNQDPLFNQFSPYQKHKLLQHWARFGNPRILRRHLERYPDITTAPGFYQAQSFASHGDYEEATRIVTVYLRQPPFPEFVSLNVLPERELQAAVLKNPRDIVRASILLERQLERSDLDAAYRTFNMLQLDGEMPDYLTYWLGRLQSERGLYEAAWKTWQPYIWKDAESRVRKPKNQPTGDS